MQFYNFNVNFISYITKFVIFGFGTSLDLKVEINQKRTEYHGERSMRAEILDDILIISYKYYSEQ